MQGCKQKHPQSYHTWPRHLEKKDEQWQGCKQKHPQSYQSWACYLENKAEQCRAVNRNTPVPTWIARYSKQTLWRQLDVNLRTFTRIVCLFFVENDIDVRTFEYKVSKVEDNGRIMSDEHKDSCLKMRSLIHWCTVLTICTDVKHQIILQKIISRSKSKVIWEPYHFVNAWTAKTTMRKHFDGSLMWSLESTLRFGFFDNHMSCLICLNKTSKVEVNERIMFDE